MSHLVFVETSGSGIGAIEYAKQTGHMVTYLYSPDYDFTAMPEQREVARRLADHAVLLPENRRPEGIAHALNEVGVQTASVDAVLSTLAFCVPAAAALAETIGARGVPPAGVELARDKGRCRDALREAGIASAQHVVVMTAGEALAAAELIGYPVIIKPVLGIGKAATAIVRTPEQARAYFAGLRDELAGLASGISGHLDERFIVEELLIGDLLSVEVAADGKAFTPLICTRQKTALDNPVLELGCTVPSGLGDQEEWRLGEYAVTVCRALGLNLGVFHVEVIHTARGFVLTEANPRIAGGALPDTVNSVADRNMFHILVDLHLDLPVPPQPLRLEGAASHSILAAARSQTIREDLPHDWFETFRPRIHSGFAAVQPGVSVARMRGNFDKLGMVRAVAPDIAQVLASLADVTADIERALRLPLVREGVADYRTSLVADVL